jgi:hypothetical protein
MSAMMLKSRISSHPYRSPAFSKSKALRYMLLAVLLLLAVLSAALYVDITSYARSIHTIPECALENHHGMGNCPIQILRRYPYLEEELRNRKASHISSWPIRPERVKLDRPKQPRP